MFLSFTNVLFFIYIFFNIFCAWFDFILMKLQCYEWKNNHNSVTVILFNNCLFFFAFVIYSKRLQHTIHHADETFPNPRPLCGLPSLGSHCGYCDSHHLHDVHEHVHWKWPDLWVELWLPQIRGGTVCYFGNKLHHGGG